jgi:plastocyanin
MRAPLGSAGDGLYEVSYHACWPDASCHDGKFAFWVESAKAMSFSDMTGKAEVIIQMDDLAFSPANAIVSKGTKVVWKNVDGAVHFVNSDPHPSHNAAPSLNSSAIEGGRSYEFVFNEAGEWGYHCSAHAPQGMAGHIVVR